MTGQESVEGAGAAVDGAGSAHATRPITAVIGLFICACGHPKASHRPHGGRRAPSSGWVCRKNGCDCKQYGEHGVTVSMA